MKKTDEQLLAEAQALDAAYASAAVFDAAHGPCCPTVTRWQVYWDNGGDACGVFPDTYATEDEATAAAEAIYQDNIAEGIWGDDASTEAIAVDVPDPDWEDPGDQMDELRRAGLNHRGQP